MKKIFILLLSTLILTSCSAQDKSPKVLEEDGNIYVVLTDGTKKQLTSDQIDSDPVLLPDNEQVIFVRNQFVNEHQIKIIMQIRIDDLNASLLTDQKPYEDGLYGTYDIMEIINPTVSLDGKHLFFVTEKYATGSQLVKVNIETGEWTELFTAESFEIIDKGSYKGNFLVGQSLIEDENGRDIYYRLLDESGKIIKKFSDEESMNVFKAELK